METPGEYDLTTQQKQKVDGTVTSNQLQSVNMELNSQGASRIFDIRGGSNHLDNTGNNLQNSNFDIQS